MNILKINASPRKYDSVSRQLVDRLVARISLPTTTVIDRDLTTPLPQITELWLHAYWTAQQDRTADQTAALALSDELVAEVHGAQALVFGVPIYNFGVPASLKAWVDLVARDKETFVYHGNDPSGLLRNKSAFVVMTSGGIPIDDPHDHATPFLRTFLQFIGITDITVIDAGMLAVDEPAAIAKAWAQIDALSSPSA